MASVRHLHPSVPAPTADPTHLAAFHERWLAQHPGPAKDRGARPDGARYLFIGCSDHGVPAYEMMGVGPDEVLELRNLANLAPATDASTRSCIELALQQGVEHIIVCGHYGCRSCEMALQPPTTGALTPWLNEVRELYRHYEGTLDALQGAERARHVVELNVRTQVMHILELPVVQLSLQDDPGPKLHGWVFDPVTGKIRDLNLNIAGLLEQVQRVYRLR